MMNLFKHKGLFLFLSLLCIFGGVATSIADAEMTNSAACSHIFAEKEEQNYRISASMNIAKPLDDVVYIAIQYSYLQPVNYEVQCFRLYYTESEWIEIPFVPELQPQPEAPSIFASLIPLYDGFPNAKLVPVISTGGETEEMYDVEILFGDDEPEKQAKSFPTVI